MGSTLGEGGGNNEGMTWGGGTPIFRAVGGSPPQSPLVEKALQGVLNAEADKESRQQELRTEWMLNRQDFKFLVEKLGLFQQLTYLHHALIISSRRLCHTGQILNVLLWIHSNNHEQVWNFMLSHLLYVYPG